VIGFSRPVVIEVAQASVRQVFPPVFDGGCAQGTFGCAGFFNSPVD